MTSGDERFRFEVRFTRNVGDPSGKKYGRAVEWANSDVNGREDGARFVDEKIEMMLMHFTALVRMSPEEWKVFDLGADACIRENRRAILPGENPFENAGPESPDWKLRIAYGHGWGSER